MCLMRNFSVEKTISDPKRPSDPPKLATQRTAQRSVPTSCFGRNRARDSLRRSRELLRRVCAISQSLRDP